VQYGFASALLVLICFGCHRDQGPERIIVLGTITYKGKPIPDGTIRFAPVATSAVPMAGGDVKDGRYKIDSRGGVPVGTHKIEIEAFRVATEGMKPGVAPPPVMSRGVPRVQYLPKRYNVDSQLQITIESGSKEITKSFDLTD
jgi:hypothetical protein